MFASIEEDVVETDTSLLPFEQTESENVLTIPNLFNTVYYVKSGPKPYAEVVF